MSKTIVWRLVCLGDGSRGTFCHYHWRARRQNFDKTGDGATMSASTSNLISAIIGDAVLGGKVRTSVNEIVSYTERVCVPALAKYVLYNYYERVVRSDSDGWGSIRGDCRCVSRRGDRARPLRIETSLETPEHF